MEGEIGNKERMTKTPSSILGDGIYKELILSLPKIIPGDFLNSSKIHKNESAGTVIHFSRHGRKELSSSDWLSTQQEALRIFSDLKYTYSDQPEFKPIQISFVDEDERGKCLIVIKEES